MSDSAQSPVKQKTSFKRQKMVMPILFMVKNGNAFAVYSPKDPANISTGSLFRIPTIFYGFHYHPLPYITITAFQFSKQSAINIPHNCYFTNTGCGIHLNKENGSQKLMVKHFDRQPTRREIEYIRNKLLDNNSSNDFYLDIDESSKSATLHEIEI